MPLTYSVPFLGWGDQCKRQPFLGQRGRWTDKRLCADKGMTALKRMLPNASRNISDRRASDMKSVWSARLSSPHVSF